MILFWKFKELSCPADGDLQVKSQLWSHPFFCYYLCCQASQRVRTQVQWSLRTCVSLVWIPAQTVPSTTTPSCSCQRLFKNSEQRHFSDRVSSHQVVWVCDSRSYSGALHESSWWHRLPGWPVQISCRTNCRETQWGFRLTVLDWTEGRLTMKKWRLCPTYPFSPLLMTEGSVSISPTPAEEQTDFTTSTPTTIWTVEP